MPTPTLIAQNLSKTYQMGEVTVPALRGVDLTLFDDEIIVILGPSGSGKSTLLNILGGLDTPSEGTVTYHDHVLTDANEVELTQYRREHVGFVFQFYNLIANLTAKENVMLVTDIAENPINPEHALEMVGLEPRSEHFPAQMSGGEQQRVAIARAIAKHPDLLLCDEPTGALDCETGILVLKALLRANKELSSTVAIITHNVAIAAIADRVIHIADGRIAKIIENKQRANPETLSW